MNKKYLSMSPMAALFLMFVLSAIPAMAGTVRITTGEGNGADAFINNDSRYPDGDANTNYGSNAEINLWDYFDRWDGEEVMIYRKSYLRFDLTNAPSNIVSGKLTITPSVDNTFFFYNIYALKETADSWTEGTVTWNNAPANLAGLGIDENFAGIYGAYSFYGAPDVPLSRDLPQNLIDFLNEDTDNKVTLILVPYLSQTGGVAARYYAKEGTTDATKMPTLELVGGAPTSVTVRGTVSLGDYAGDSSVPVAVKVELRQNGVTILEKQQILDTNGQFTVNNITPGVYDVAIKGCVWLEKVIPAVDLTSEDIVDLGSIPLVNGDNDGDNSVTSTDLSIILKNME